MSATAHVQNDHTVASEAEDDARFMALAIALGRRQFGRTWPNPAVGALVVKDGVIVGRGWTQDGGRPHAETQALAHAGAAARGATLYVSLEPCSHHGKTPPCADAIIAAGIARVVSALDDPNSQVAGQGLARLRAHGVEVLSGIGADEARRAHDGHIRRMQTGRPHITLKLALSSDGKIGSAGRKPVALTGEGARDRVHLLRAQHDGVLVGIGTALADNPLLTCRLPGMEARSPVRIVLDRALQLPVTGKLAATAQTTPLWIVAAQSAPEKARAALIAGGAKVLAAAQSDDGLDLENVFQVLAREGLTRILVEGGAKIAASLVKADLVDEAILLRASKAIGEGGIDALEGLPLDALTRSPQLRPCGEQRLGADVISFFERT